VVVVILERWGLLEKGVLGVKYPVSGDGGETSSEDMGSCVAFEMLKVEG
jgi:hypothetical protein